MHVHDAPVELDGDDEHGEKHPTSGKTLNLTARVIPSQQQLDANANYMGNCTSGYHHSLAEGSTVIVALDDEEGRGRVNVEMRRDSGAWHPGEINTRFNGYGIGGARPASLGRVADRLAQLLNSQRP